MFPAFKLCHHSSWSKKSTGVFCIIRLSLRLWACKRLAVFSLSLKRHHTRLPCWNTPVIEDDVLNCTGLTLCQCSGRSEIPWTSLLRASKAWSVSVGDEPWQPAAGQRWFQYSVVQQKTVSYNCIPSPPIHVSGSCGKMLLTCSNFHA